MKKKKNKKYNLLKIAGYFAVLITVVPYALLQIVDRWEIRWFFGCLVFCVTPFLFLYMGLDLRFQFTRVKPEDLKTDLFHRYVDLFCRLLLIVLAIVTIYSQTFSYIHFSYRLMSNGFRTDKITGIIEKTYSTGKAGIIYRSIYLENNTIRYKLLYPFGKRHHPNQSCELLLLPGSHIAVDLKITDSP